MGEASVCKNSMYELVCNSIKLGGATISLILPKLIRSVARDGILDLYWMAGHQAEPFSLQQTTGGKNPALNSDIRRRGNRELADSRNPKRFWGSVVFLILI